MHTPKFDGTTLGGYRRLTAIWTILPPMRSDSPNSGYGALWLSLGYILLYALGYSLKPSPASAAIWPSHVMSFAAFILLPLRVWPLIALGIISTELLSVPLINWITHQSEASLTATLGFAFANVLTTAGPAGLARGLHLFHAQDRRMVVISPVWIVALFVGALPGALLGEAAHAHAAGTALLLEDVGLWLVAAVLTIVSFGPAVFGLLLGFSEPSRPSAQRWERWGVASLVLALFAWFYLAPWPGGGQLVEPMLFAIPLCWLALRFSRRATSIAVAIVAIGVVVIVGRWANPGDPSHLESWRSAVLAIDIFLLIGCGGASLINLMTLKQRALLDELSAEHTQLRHYALALDRAEASARRAIASDLHDGACQVLAGQSMIIAAMRGHEIDASLGALLEEVAATSREAQECLRVVIQDLGPPDLLHASVEETLRKLADVFQTRFGFTLTSQVCGSTDVRPDHLHFIYRCVRELLMNALKHSQRRSAEVKINLCPTAIEIAVIDQGVGFDASRVLPQSGYRVGLAQLRERARTMGGSLDVDAVVGKGCRVLLRLPLLSLEPKQ
jgi:signal transduction histidine kinase